MQRSKSFSDCVMKAKFIDLKTLVNVTVPHKLHFLVLLLLQREDTEELL